jgi:hypothetical protein
MKQARLHDGKRGGAKPSLRLAIWWVSAAAIIGVLGEPNASPPQTLVEAARAFIVAPPSNRLTEAQGVVRELPRCPLKYERDVGTGIYRAYDYTKPSYVLSAETVLNLLGNPTTSKTNGASVRLLYLARRRLTLASPEDWFLNIELHAGRVVYSNVATSGTRQAATHE